MELQAVPDPLVWQSYGFPLNQNLKKVSAINPYNTRIIPGYRLGFHDEIRDFKNRDILK
jgi:hypothetical protein